MSATRDPVAKALDLIKWCVDNDAESVGVRETSIAMNVAPSSAHRLLRALADKGFLAQDASTGRYHLGSELFRMGQAAARRAPLRSVALPEMRKLVDECNETAMLGVYDPARREMMLAASVDCTHALRFVLTLHTWLPLHTGASGLAILAYLPDSERRTIVARAKDAAPITENTITDPRRLNEQLATIRKRGFSVTHGQRTRGAVGIATPVFGPASEVVGDLILNIPEQRFDQRTETRLASRLMQVALDVTHKLGGRSPEGFPRPPTADARPKSARSRRAP